MLTEFFLWMVSANYRFIREETVDEYTVYTVGEFHKAFNVDYWSGPTIPTPERAGLRIELFREELQELHLALESGNMANILDALCDLQYVLDGTFLECGLQDFKDAAMREVHRSNMSKLGEDGKPILREDGKIIKGPNYFAPYLRAVLNGDIT